MKRVDWVFFHFFYSGASKTIRFHNIFAAELSTSFAQAVLDAIYTYAPFIQFTIDEPLRRVGGVLLQEDSCEISLVPVNYTDTMTVFPTIMPSSPMVQPTLGMCIGLV